MNTHRRTPPRQHLAVVVLVAIASASCAQSPTAPASNPVSAMPTTAAQATLAEGVTPAATATASDVATPVEESALPVEATPAATSATVDPDVILVSGTPPLYDGGEAPLTPPLSYMPLDPDQLVRAFESWVVDPDVDRTQLQEVPTGSFPRPSEPGWYLLCLAQNEGRYCEPAMVGPSVFSVDIAGDGGTVVVCPDRTIVEVAGLDQQPARPCP